MFVNCNPTYLSLKSLSHKSGPYILLCNPRFISIVSLSLTTERYVSVTVVPYFGKLAGREVYFHVFKDNDTIEINLGLHNSIYGPLLCDKDFKLR